MADLYAECLEKYFLANDVEAGDKQRAILLSVCGPATYQLIRNLAAPASLQTTRSLSWSSQDPCGFYDLTNLLQAMSSALRYKRENSTRVGQTRERGHY